MNQEAARNFIVQWVRAGNPKANESTHGYDVYIPLVIDSWIQEHHGLLEGHPRSEAEMEVSGAFLDGAWELCLRGVLRPGVNVRRGHAIPGGSGGQGFAITEYGHEFFSEEAEEFYVPTQPDAFGKLLDPLKGRFGSGFHERAQQAVICLYAHADLACCAMCGAAAESILLAVAIAKTGDEAKILQTYQSKDGLRDIENIVLGQADDRIKREFMELTALIGYWRNEAADDLVTDISSSQARTSIATLLRHAMFVDSNWDDLTA